MAKATQCLLNDGISSHLTDRWNLWLRALLCSIFGRRSGWRPPEALCFGSRISTWTRRTRIVSHKQWKENSRAQEFLLNETEFSLSLRRLFCFIELAQQQLHLRTLRSSFRRAWQIEVLKKAAPAPLRRWEIRSFIVVRKPGNSVEGGTTKSMSCQMGRDISTREPAREPAIYMNLHRSEISLYSNPSPALGWISNRRQRDNISFEADQCRETKRWAVMRSPKTWRKSNW